MASARILTMAGTDDDSLVTYLTQAASHKGNALYKLPQFQQVVLLNRNHDGDLCDGSEKDIVTWVLLQLMVFENNNTEYLVWACRNCDVIFSLARTQDPGRLVNNICCHSKVLITKY